MRSSLSYCASIRSVVFCGLLIFAHLFAMVADVSAQSSLAGTAWGYGNGSGALLPLTEPKLIADGAVSVSAGANHTMFIKNDGTLWGMGNNDAGPLGNGTTTSTSTPVQVASGVASVSASTQFTMFIKTDGTLWGMGNNGNGQLGDGTTMQRNFPVQVAASVAAVATGGAHTLFLKLDGTLWAMGSNQNGQIGNTSVSPFGTSTPLQIATEVIAIASGAGAGSSYFIKADHTLWAMGDNVFGQLGVGSALLQIPVPSPVASQVAAISVCGNSTLFIKTDGTLWGMGSNNFGQLGNGTVQTQYSSPVQVATNVAKVSLGNDHTLFIKTDGTLWGMGANDSGQLANGNAGFVAQGVPIPLAIPGVASVATGPGYTMLVLSDSKLLAVGGNDSGQLGDRQPTPHHGPLATDVTSVGANYPNSNLFAKSDGTLWQQQGNDVSQVLGVSGVVQAIQGTYNQNRLYLKIDGTLWQLGANNTSIQIASDVVTAGAGFVYIAAYLKTDGTLWGLGGNGSEVQFGDGTAPVQIADHVVSVSTAGWHLLFVKDDQTLWGLGQPWSGFNDAFQWGQYKSTPVQLETGVIVAAASTNAGNLYIKAGGQLWSRGSGWSSSTGPAALVDTGVVSAVAAGGGSLYFKSDGTLHFRSGILGTLGSVTDIAGGILELSNGPDGWAIYRQTAGFGTVPAITTQPESATVGSGLVANLQVGVSGTNPFGYQWFKNGVPISWAQAPQLVIPYATLADTGDYSVQITNSAGTIMSATATLTVRPPAPKLTSQTPWQNVFAGNSASFDVAADYVTSYNWQRSVDGGATWSLIFDDGTYSGTTTARLTVNGTNAGMNGQKFRLIGSNVTGTAASVPATLSIISLPSAAGLAWNYNGQPGTLLTLTVPRTIAGNVQSVSLAARNAMILKSDGTLWSMGENPQGQLGNGTTSMDPSSTPVQVASGVAAVSAGANHTMFIKTDGTLWGMGYNEDGELGDGTTTQRLFPVQVAAGVTAVACGSNHTLFIKSDGTLWGMGQSVSGQLGFGTSSYTPTSVPVQIATGVVEISTGPWSASSYFVKSGGILWAMGDNTNGQLGDGTTTQRLSPVQVATDVASISSGLGTAMFVKTDRTLWGMGANASGQLGDGSTVQRNSPVQVATGVGQVSVGSAHTFFIKTDGSVWGMGSNYYGELALGTVSTTPQSTPVQIAASGVSSAIAGSLYTMLVMTDHTLRVVGSNSYGQLGDRQSTPSPTILLNSTVAVGADLSSDNLFVKSDGTLWQIQNTSQTTQVAGVSGVVQAITGAYGQQRLYLKGDGTLWQLAVDGTSTQVASDVISAGAGLNYYVYLKGDGTLWNSGLIGFNPAPQGQIADHVLSVSTAGWHLLFVKDDHTMWGMGQPWGGFGSDYSFGQYDATPVQLETGIASAWANSNANLYLKTDGTLWTRGSGWAVWNGPAAQVDSSVVSAANNGSYGSLYLKADGILHFRSGIQGALGPITTVAEGIISVSGGTDGWGVYLQTPGFGTTPAITTQPTSATIATGSVTILQVSANGTGPISYQWFKDGVALSWAQSAQLAIPYTLMPDAGSYTVTVTNSAGTVTSSSALLTVLPPAPTITSFTPWQRIFAGSTASFIVTSSGPASYQWQQSTDGGATWTDLGDDNTYAGSTTATLSISGTDQSMSGWKFRAIASSAGGSTTTAESTLTIVALPTAAGFAWGYDGRPDTLLTLTMPRTIAGKVEMVSFGGQHTLFISSDGTLWSMGSNVQGQLGNGTTSLDPNSTPVQVASGVASVSSGGNHTMFIKTDGTLWGMGYNEDGELGDGTNNLRTSPVQVATGVTAVACGSSHTLFIKSDGTLWGMGRSAEGQLGLGTSSFNPTSVPVQIATGVVAIATSPWSFSSYFIKSDGTLWSMGDNTNGQLGDGTTTQRLSPVQVTTGVASVASGLGTAMFIKTDRTLWGMGANASGQLGDGSTVTRNSPVQVATEVGQVSIGSNHAFFIKTDGSVWGMGSNYIGELALGTTSTTLQSTPVQISGSGVSSAIAGSSCTSLVMSDHTLRVVGNNNYGQLGDRQPTPGPAILAANTVAVGADLSVDNLFVKSDGTLWQNQNSNQSTQVAGVNGVVQAITGAYGQQRLYLKGDGTLWQLALDGTSTPVASGVIAAGAGLNYYVYLKSDGTLWNSGMIGFNPAPQGQIADHVLSVSTAGWHILFVRDDHTLWGMGQPWGGFSPVYSWGQYDAAPVQLETGILSAWANSNANLCLKTDGTLWTRGSGWSDWNGPAVQVDSSVVSAANNGSYGSLYLKADGILYFRSGIQGVLGPITTIAEGIITVSGGTDGWDVYLQTSGFGTTPAITTQPAAATVANSSLTILQVSATGSGPLAYQWFKDGLAISWARSPQLVIPYMAAADVGAYTVSVTNSAGTITSDVAQLSIQPPPVIFNSLTATGTYGQSFSFTVTASNQPTGFTATGLPAGLTLDQTTGEISGSPTVAGSFPVLIGASNGGGSDSRTLQLTIAKASAAVTLGNLSQIYDATPKSVAVSTAPVSNLQTTVTYNGSVTVPTALGSYAVVATVTDPNYQGSATGTLLIHTAPLQILTQPAATTAIVGRAATFTVVATGTGPINYQWKKGIANIVGATSATLTIPNVQPTDAATSYRVVVSNSATTLTSTNATLTVIAPVAISAQPQNQTVNAGQTASFSVTATGTATLTYQWRKNGINIPVTTRTLSLTSVSSAAEGTYSVVVTNAAGSVTSANATLVVNEIATQPTGSTVIVGGSATFAVGVSGSTPVSYQWRRNGTNIASATAATLALTNVQSAQAGTYSVVITFAAGRLTSANAVLTVITPVTITSQPQNLTKNAGQNATFSVIAKGTAPLTYQWRRNGVNIAGASAASLALTNVSAANDGTYSVLVTNAAGSIPSADATLIVITPPSIATQPAPVTVARGGTAAFTVVVAGTAPLTYQWKKGNTNIPGANAATLTLTNVQPSAAATYKVVVSNPAGSVTSAPAQLTVQ